MNPRPYHYVSGMIFFVVGLLHLLRMWNNWDVQFGPWAVPNWVSFVGCPVAWVLSVWGFGSARGGSGQDARAPGRSVRL
jgi:hypothetical protein